jgi:rod shape determining protein RodA
VESLVGESNFLMLSKSTSLETESLIPQEVQWDWLTPLCLVVLSLMSILFIHSAQAYGGGNYWKMQILWCVIGFTLYTVMALINYQIWLRYAHFIYFSVLIGLLLVFGGPMIYGARRWIDFGIFKVQPSEIAKWSTMIFGASLLARSKVGDMQDSLRGILKVAACFSLPMFLIFLQPDLGSTLVFPPIAFSLLYVARMPTKFFVSTFVVFVVLLGLLGFDLFHYYQYKLENPKPSDAVVAYEDTSLLPLKDYQRKRILTFVAPEVEDPHGIGSNWNRIQALIAVATGGVSGKGFGEGMQAKLGYLPTAVAHNDFIFAVIAEEAGLLGGGLAIGMLGLVVFGCLRVAAKSADRFGSMLAVGVSVLLMTHIFINIGMTIGITPITGLPLPFLSYGGSFMVVCFLMLGMVQSVFRHRNSVL